MSIKSWLVSKAIGWLSWKLVLALVAAAGVYIGALHLRLHAAQAERDAARTELTVAQDANVSNLLTITNLRVANKAFADAQKMSEEAQEKLRNDAQRAREDAARARQQLARDRELDRRAPDCAALLDRSLAVCPDLVRRLWPDAARPN